MEIYREEFLPVDPDCFLFRGRTPCDLFMRFEGERFSLFAKKGLPFDREAFARSDILAQRRLYIRNEEVHAYYASLKRHLFQLVNDPHASAAEKAQAVHSACLDIVKRVFYDPVVSMIHEACDIILAATHLVDSDPAATALLMRLTKHDSGTFIHSTNVGIFSTALARYYYGSGFMRELEQIAPAFFFHDIGKQAVAAKILNKPGPLNPSEWDIIRRHPETGCQMLEKAGCLSGESSVIPLQHHERDDGSGYPLGISGREIHPFARICRMADIFEALTSQRPYRQGLSAFDSLKIMRRDLTDLDRGFFERFVQLFSSPT